MIVTHLPFNKSIGGHAITSILGYNSYKSATDIWEELTGKKQDNFKPSLITDAGNALQPVVLRYWAEETGEKYLENVNYIDDNYSYITGHIDAVTLAKAKTVGKDSLYINDDYYNLEQVIEVKTVYFGRSYLFGEEGTNEIPLPFLIQTAWYCRLANLPSAVILVFSNGTTYKFTYFRDPVLESYLLSRAIEFWTNHVLTDIPPMPTTIDEVNRYYKKSNEKTIVATDELFNIIHRLREVKAIHKASGNEIEELEMKIKLYMQENETLEFQGDKLLTWKSYDMQQFQASKFKEAYPAMYKKFTETVTRRPLKLK